MFDPVLVWARVLGCTWGTLNALLLRHCGRAPGGAAVRGGTTARGIAVCANLAAWNRHLEVVRRVREHHCPWDETSCEMSTCGRSVRAPGGVEVGSGSPLQVERCERCHAAAGGGHLECYRGRGSTAARGAMPLFVQRAAERGHVEKFEVDGRTPMEGRTMRARLKLRVCASKHTYF